MPQTPTHSDPGRARTPLKSAMMLYGFYIALYLVFAGVIQAAHVVSSALVASAMASGVQAGDSMDPASSWSDDTGECVPPSRTVISFTPVSD